MVVIFYEVLNCRFLLHFSIIISVYLMKFHHARIFFDEDKFHARVIRIEEKCYMISYSILQSVLIMISFSYNMRTSLYIHLISYHSVYSWLKITILLNKLNKTRTNNYQRKYLNKIFREKHFEAGILSVIT